MGWIKHRKRFFQAVATAAAAARAWDFPKTVRTAW